MGFKATNYGKGSMQNNMVSFGVHGWGTIIYCLLMFWFYVGMVNDGSNFSAPAVAAALGTETGVILSTHTVGGLIGVVIFIIIGQINKKVGARILGGLSMILGGFCYMMLANCTSVAMYVAFYSGVVGFVMGGSYLCGGALVTRWFPKRKGIVMGYTTMGHNLASAFYVPIIGALVGGMAVAGLRPLGIACMILGVVGLILVRNNPQERGQNPDYVSDEIYQREYDTSDDDAGALETGGWTLGKLLKTKELWLAAAATGLFQLCSTGVMTQLVNRNLELGMTVGKATTVMTILALGGVAGSWLIGVFDEKFGTKRTMFGFAIWYGLALLCNFAANINIVFLYISLVMIAVAIGGSANFMTSLPAAVFGRHGFDLVNSVIFPIQGAITVIANAINGQILLATGQLRYAYLVLAVIAFANIIVIALVDEHKYNRDFKAAQTR